MYMKRFLTALIAFCILTSSAAIAAPTATPSPEAADTTVTELSEPTASPKAVIEDEVSPSPEATASPSVSPSPEVANVPKKELSSQFVLDLTIAYRKYVIADNAMIELYDMDDNLLGTAHDYVGWGTSLVQLVFDVPEYRMGTKFKVKLVSGLRSIWYCGQQAQPGEMLEVETYGYLDEDGEYKQCNGASLDAYPQFEKEIHMYITDKWYDDMSPYARIVDGVTMVPVRAVADAMNLDVKYNPEWDSVTLSIEDHETAFWANNEYMAYPGGDKNASHKPIYIENSLFVPVRDLAEAFDCTVEVADYGEYMDVLIGEAPYYREVMNRTPVNRNGITSRTNYLIWVSKHEYKVRVYEGRQYNWKLLKEYPCALGAWDTPTITGQFEIIERTQWDYGTYYVGPVLRFYNGYALHSTLLYYGGGEYDGRVGVNISHGCIRLHPGDINWIAKTVPFKTRVYITE